MKVLLNDNLEKEGIKVFEALGLGGLLLARVRVDRRAGRHVDERAEQYRGGACFTTDLHSH